MVYTNFVFMVASKTGNTIKKAAYSSKGLYKFLLRQCNKLPQEEIIAYYKHHVRQGFNQHADETDPERVSQIINQAVKDIDWVLKKSSKMEPLNSQILENPDAFTVESQVSSIYKFFHALSTFASRPELLMSHIRSTDIDWESVDTPLRKCYNNLICENLFEVMYSPIYHQGKCLSSTGAGELSGSLNEETIRSWVTLENEYTHLIRLRRQIHHKPVKNAKFGRSSFVEELWDFVKGTVTLEPVVQSDATPFAIAPFVTLHASYMREEKIAKLTVKRFTGRLLDNEEDGMEFYKATLIPKILEWMSDDYTVEPPGLTRLRARPLTYANNSFYWFCYDFLKFGPAEEIKLVWEESTDPVKFIHEDIGIASYIVSLIFAKRCRYMPLNNKEYVEILDLGCGNGLLCFFVSQLLQLFATAGSVIGFDIRRRKIWNKLKELFSKPVSRFKLDETTAFPILEKLGKIKLQITERTFVPHQMDDLLKTYACGQERRNNSLWIIGNHSDELTPWIPVVARRLNATGFFIIPCCPYDFFRKFQRRANLPGSSVYRNYIEYICTVGDKFGYLPMLDKLRIPSTKNICLIGLDCSRKFESNVLNAEVNFILKELQDGDKGNTLSKFVPRPKESVKEAPKLDKITSESIVNKIFNLLLRDWNNALQLQGWYTGRDDLTFQEIFRSLAQNEKDMLKGKGNGLKTLVSSNRHLFITHDFYVKLRVPNENYLENMDQSCRSRIKTRPCYFFRHHPQGCPLSSEQCTFKH